MQLNHIKRLRELKAAHGYTVAQLQESSPTTDEELLYLLEVLNLQKEMTDSINAFAQRDFFESKESVKIILGALAHVSARVVTRAAQLEYFDESALIEMHHNLFEDQILLSIGDELDD